MFVLSPRYHLESRGHSIIHNLQLSVSAQTKENQLDVIFAKHFDCFVIFILPLALQGAQTKVELYNIQLLEQILEGTSFPFFPFFYFLYLTNFQHSPSIQSKLVGHEA